MNANPNLRELAASLKSKAVRWLDRTHSASSSEMGVRPTGEPICLETSSSNRKVAELSEIALIVSHEEVQEAGQNSTVWPRSLSSAAVCQARPNGFA